MKKQIKEYLTEHQYEFEREEIDNVLEILENYDANLTDLSRVDYSIIGRLIDDVGLTNRLETRCVPDTSSDNPFN